LADIKQDLDTPRALQQLRKLEKDELISGATKAACFSAVDEVYGLEIARAPKAKAEATAEILELLEKRKLARESKDFAASDNLRDQLLKLGQILLDLFPLHRHYLDSTGLRPSRHSPSRRVGLLHLCSPDPSHHCPKDRCPNPNKMPPSHS
jgi:hypothetical protein